MSRPLSVLVVGDEAVEMLGAIADLEYNPKNGAGETT